MATGRLLWLGNLLLPGAGLVMRGRLVAGLLLLLLALVAVVALLLGELVASPGFGEQVRVGSMAAYGALAVGATALWWWWERHRRWDREVVIDLHRQAASAYLADDLDQAHAVARALVARAPDLDGSWRLLALVAAARGDEGQRRRAERQVRRLLDREG